jgi:hypothetical protein
LKLSLVLPRFATSRLTIFCLLFTGCMGCAFGATKAPVARVFPDSLAFGSETVGKTTAAKYVTIRNVGNANLAFSSDMGITGKFDFAGTGTCTAVTPVAPGKSCTVSVKFTPTAAGWQAGVLSVKDNAGSQIVELEGKGIATSSGSGSDSGSSGSGSGSGSATTSVSCSVYVSPSGSDSNSGTLDAPWRTINTAFADMKSGDTLCLRGGTYPNTVSSGYSQTFENLSGTASKPLIITNYPGEVAIVDGSTRVQAAYVTFQGTPMTSSGLIFQGPTPSGMDLIDVMYSHDVTFNHVEIRDGSYHAGIYQYDGYNIKLLGSYIHDNGRPGQINTDNGIYWDATTGGGNLIADCVVEHNVAQGIQLYPAPTNVVVEENTIVNNGNWVALYGSNNFFVNNIMSGNGAASGNPQVDIEGTGYTINSNLTWSAQSSQIGVLNDSSQSVTKLINANPMFVNPSAHNYQLQSGSPAIGAGNSSYTQPIDRNGTKRPSPPAIGAYQ